MDPGPGAHLPGGTSPSILVVEDDRRLRELLEIALTAHGFEVLTAADGDEAVKRALASRPDLVVLDVRLPKKSGLEVCEILRRDPDDPSIPIILVSAAVEIDARLQAFSRGADDYLPKPFSPKELVARIKRLLSRSSEARTALHRAQELERELARLRDEVRRVHDESRREQRLREIATGLGRELLGSLDLDTVAERLLLAVQTRLGVGCAGLLVRDRADGALRGHAVRGDAFDRIAALEVLPRGELAAVLTGLGRPALAAELERLPEVRAEIAPFFACGFQLLAPLIDSDDLAALIVMDERLDGTEHARADWEVLAGLCEIGAVALQNAQRFQVQVEELLGILAARAPAGADAFAGESAAIVMRAARATLLAPRFREPLRHGLALGAWALTAEGCRSLDRLRGFDPTGRIEVLKRLLERAGEPEASPDPWAPEEQRAALLLRVGLESAASRAGGAAIDEAIELALQQAGPALDPATGHALLEAARDAALPDGEAAPSRRSA